MAWRKSSIGCAAAIMTVVLFARPRPLNRDAVDQDGITHQAFSLAWEDYDAAMQQAKELGKFHRSVERDSGNTIYMFDSEGNYLELHFARPGGRRHGKANYNQGNTRHTKDTRSTKFGNAIIRNLRSSIFVG